MNSIIGQYLANAVGVSPTAFDFSSLNDGAYASQPAQPTQQAVQSIAQSIPTVNPPDLNTAEVKPVTPKQIPNQSGRIGFTPLDASPALYSHIADVEKKNGLPEGLLVSIKDKGEKSGSHAVSPAGAMGSFQFIPSTWKQYGNGGNPTDPFASASAAGAMFKDLLRMYQGNVAAAVAHYNGGTKQGKLVMAGYEPSYPETKNYLKRVLA